MTDRYQNFADLSADMQEGVDYRIRSSDCGTSVVILAPHGGSIEPETAEIAEAIATEKRIAEATNAGELHAKAEAERMAQEKAQREADLRRGREPDDEAHVLYLQQLLELPNVDGVDAFLEVSTRWPDLGPACGLSRAERVLRIVHIRADWDWQAVSPETPGVQVPRPKDKDQRREGAAVLDELRKRQFATP